MTDTDEDKQWEERFAKVKDAHAKLELFIFDAEDNGLISSETRRAVGRVMTDVLRKAGIVDGRIGINKTDKAVLTTVFTQSIHEGRQFLLKTQPEIAEILDKEVPPFKGGRSL